ncbi:MAG TPA: L,D-transpeptidase family protein [Gemmatimonadales bacterium]
MTVLPLLGLLALACRSPGHRPTPSPTLARPGFGDLAVGVVQRLVGPEDDGVVARFYAARQYRTAWVDGPGQVRRALEALDVVGRSAEDGLDPGRYAPDAVREVLARAGDGTESLATVDVRLSELVLAYARDLALGQVDPAAIDSLWRSGNSFDVVAAVAAAVDADAVRGLPDRLRPPHVGYAALRAALARHRSAAPTAVDTAADVAARIALNLERWRWLPRDLGRRHVMVNFAAFDATAVDDGVEALRTRVVAGRRDWPTPIASGQLTVVVANPRWNVPREIAVREILPLIRADSAFLDREGMVAYRGTQRIDPRTVAWAVLSDTAFPYHLVQAPGPRNPLGRVKLVFANPFNVALHDTPARALFAQAERAASHGCVRVERAVDFAMWALDAPGRDSLLLALTAPEERAIAPGRGGPVMVHLVYWTVSVAEAGALQLRDDLYGWDARLARALETQ